MKIIISSFSPFNGAFFHHEQSTTYITIIKDYENLLDGDHHDDDTDDDCLEVMKTEIKNSNSMKNVLIINGRYKFQLKEDCRSFSNCSILKR